MNQTNTMTGIDRRSIVRATLWALLAGALITVTVVLPAEYGVDPTGFGRLTGLTAMARAGQQGAEAPAVAETGAPVNADASGTAPPLTVWAVAHSEKYHAETFEVTLKGDEEAEYKAIVTRGDSMLYTWRVKEGSQVYFEFHGQPSEGTWPKDYYESYEKGESTGGQGAMVSPFTGEHGWFWLNLSDQPVTIVVELAGYYSKFGRYGEGE